MNDIASQIFPMGDNAIIIELAKTIESAVSEKLIAMQRWFLTKQFPFVKDIVIGYNSLVVLYDVFKLRENDPDGIAFDKMQVLMTQAFDETTVPKMAQQKITRIPVCYAPQYAYDMDVIVGRNNISKIDVIALHTAPVYRVYMIGFLAGFPYMAQINDKLALPRKERPRQSIPEGSVGIAGVQTGIYPFTTPGGWNIIGRTPVKIFDRTKENPSFFSAGDHVQFYAIDEKEFSYLNA